ncbi:MAG TPA: peptidylprolyl isomerase [Spirochaetota bacterium]|nr:peptidylprolyl isomerase [Spirochaetota bacterium]HPI89608.1 peptidylprolyl isomerase [Spirochaetota bacterium]HPR48067.1 peptidylprolyl isomerase [Spirochaetota bacterium]
MVKNEDFILIHYTGKFDDGEVFDSSIGRDPLEFQVGSGMVIPGLDREVLGMKINDEKDISIEPADAYGEYSEEFLHAFPRSEAGSFQPEVGMTLSVQLTDGSYRPAVIKEFNDEKIVLDLNHPLAGKRLHFHITLLEINDAPKYNHGCSSCSGGDCGSGCPDDGCCC